MRKTILIMLIATVSAVFLTVLGAERWSLALAGFDQTAMKPMQESIVLPMDSSERQVDTVLPERESTEDKIDQAVNDTPEQAPEVFALFGIDTEDGAQGRSDCILLVSLEKGTLKMCSLARDTLVTIPGTGEKTKLGHAYAYGGPELAMQTIRENFGIPIYRFASVNFTQMPALIERLGGVEVPLTPAEWRYLGLGQPYLGIKRLSGQETLCYCRIRSIDNDDQRCARQQTVITSMLNQICQVPRGELPQLALAGMELTNTNLSLVDILRLGKTILMQKDDLQIQSLSIPGDSVSSWGGVRPDGVWYYVYDLDQAQEVLRDYFHQNQIQTVQGIRERLA